ncbi:MAG: hypothetical protein PHR65_03365 [Syntrophomonadaceae bacterium]|nr:hypothetical protein [Syntrophomonadaceae bacterium]
MTDKIFIRQSDTAGINTAFIENRITDAVDGLDSISKQKYERKATIIENATDMTTQEKLDALDKNYGRHRQEIFEGLVFTVLSLGLLAIAVKNPTAIKRVLRLAG